jgi:hypothetical protein
MIGSTMLAELALITRRSTYDPVGLAPGATLGLPEMLRHVSRARAEVPALRGHGGHVTLTRVVRQFFIASGIVEQLVRTA